jgi:predicted RNase H-like nuclease (RuvC/YqgF family)
MIEISENGFDYGINRIKEFADENSGLKIQNKQLVRELRAKEGEKEVLRHKNLELCRKLECNEKENKRLWESIEGLHDKLDALKEVKDE